MRIQVLVELRFPNQEETKSPAPGRLPIWRYKCRSADNEGAQPWLAEPSTTRSGSGMPCGIYPRRRHAALHRPASRAGGVQPAVLRRARRSRRRRVRRPDAHLAVADHAVPTVRSGHDASPKDWRAARSDRLIHNSERHGITYVPIDDVRHGIVHVIGPELGFTLPGLTLVCGDSHTCTHGAFGCIAFGIGASECIASSRPSACARHDRRPCASVLTAGLQPGRDRQGRHPRHHRELRRRRRGRLCARIRGRGRATPCRWKSA